MAKSRSSLNGDQIVDFCNTLIFKEAYRKGTTVADLKEEMEVRRLIPVLSSEKVFLGELINSVEGKLKSSLTVKDAREMLDESIQNKVLFKKGGDLIVTKLYLDYEEIMPEESIEVAICRLKDENVSAGVVKNMPCPYCNSEVEFSEKDVQKEYVCENCSKEFLTITGIVKRREGSFTRAVTFGAPPFVIRIKTKDRELSISFRTNYQFDADSGDDVTFIFTKGMFSKNYNLTSIANWNTKTNNVVKASNLSIN